MTEMLHRGGLTVNHKKVRKIMREEGLKAIYPGVKTTVRNKEHRIYKNKLKKLDITYPHQVWQTDITYIRTSKGFLYLTAFIDAYSRFIVGWRLSNTLEADTCLEAFKDGVSRFGFPYMVHSDQGSQFTSDKWIKLMNINHVQISMSGKGRSNDNAIIERLWRTLKYEHLIIRNCRSVQEIREEIKNFVIWYNVERPHQSLEYFTPFERLTNMKKIVLMKSE
jgi:putative transposase